MKNYAKEREALFRQNPCLRSHQRTIFARFFVEILLLETLVAAFALYLWKYTELAPFLWIGLAAVLPWVVLKPQKLFGKVGIFQITDVKLIPRYITLKKGIVTTFADKGFRNFVVYHTVSAKGHKRKFEYEGRYARAYEKGDMLIILPGIAYPINLTARNWIVCPFCGNVMPKENKECVGCGAKSVHTAQEEEEKDE